MNIAVEGYLKKHGILLINMHSGLKNGIASTKIKVIFLNGDILKFELGILHDHYSIIDKRIQEYIYCKGRLSKIKKIKRNIQKNKIKKFIKNIWRIKK